MVSEHGTTVQQKKRFFETLYNADSKMTEMNPAGAIEPETELRVPPKILLIPPQVPPQKPKRTFKHDVYLEAKLCTGAPCSSRASSEASDNAHEVEKHGASIRLQKGAPFQLAGRPKYFQLSHEDHVRGSHAYDSPRTSDVSFRRHRSQEHVYATPLVVHDLTGPKSNDLSSATNCQTLYYASADVVSRSMLTGSPYESGANSASSSRTTSQEMSTRTLDRPAKCSYAKKEVAGTQKSQLSRKFAFKKVSRDCICPEGRLPEETPDTQVDINLSLERRVSRARLVRRRTLALYDNQVQAFVSRKSPQLFESAFLIELKPQEPRLIIPCEPPTENKPQRPVSTYRFPNESISGCEAPELFFPDYSRNCTYQAGDHWPGDEEFVIALTNHVAERKNAYCVKFLPECAEDETVTPKVLVIISPIKNANFYLDLARNAVFYARSSRNSLDRFFRSVFHQEYPQKRGSCLVILEKEAKGTMRRLEIRNQGTSIGKQGSSHVIQRMSPEVVVCIVAALLGDQRILVAGNTVSVVAQTLQCLEALIRPLVWPHTYVPVVPDNLCDLAHNPTPYLMGILRNNLSPLRDLIVDDTNNNDKTQMDFMFVDIDNGLINPRPKHFDCTKDKEAWRSASAQAYCEKLGMPPKASQNLIKGFRGALAGGPGPSADVKIENAMLHWYALLFGHYKTVGAHTEWGDKMKAKLVQSHPNPHMRPYLAYLCETAMFTDWIEKKQKELGCSSRSSSDEVPGSEEALNRTIDEIASSQSSSALKPFSSFVSKVSNALSLAGRKSK